MEKTDCHWILTFALNPSAGWDIIWRRYMIKKLRMKFVAVNMAIATAMLCVILGMVYSFTSGGLERESRI